MNDVRLTATNPEDSTIVPVACNAKGELIVEPPQVVEGPPGKDGKDGEDGKDGKDGEDGKDAASFVPDPSTGRAGDVLTTDGTNCAWQQGAQFSSWYLCCQAGPSTNYFGPVDAKKVFDGSSSTYARATNSFNEPYPKVVFIFPIAITVRKLEIRIANANNKAWSVTMNGKTEYQTMAPNAWMHFPRFNAEDMVQDSSFTVSTSSDNNLYLSGIRINDQELRDDYAFNQYQLFAMEEIARREPERFKNLFAG